MTTAVRLFTVNGVSVAPVVSGTRLSYDSIQVLKLPYMGRDLLSCETGTTDTSEASAAPTGTQMAYVQVQSGKQIHYEVTPEGHTLRTADTSSPVLSGSTTMIFGPGWRIQVLEAATGT